MANNKGLKQS